MEMVFNLPDPPVRLPAMEGPARYALMLLLLLLPVQSGSDRLVLPLHWSGFCCSTFEADASSKRNELGGGALRVRDARK